MQLEPDEIEKLLAFEVPKDKKITIGLQVTEDPRSRQLKNFCRQLDGIQGLTILESRSDTAEFPWIGVGEGVFYQSVPLARELQPFLDLLQATARGEDLLSRSLRRKLAALKLPVELKLYISPQCSFCPAVVRQLLPLAAWDRNLRLRIIDATLFLELARHDQVRSVPTLILDEHFRWSGHMELEEIVAAVARQDPCRMGVSVLRGMLEEGHASRAADVMIKCGEVLPALVELLLHPKWSVRLGAMVTVEWVAEKDALLAAQVIKRLWERFNDINDQVRGDIVYLTGEFGGRSWITRLRTLCEGNFPPEVREAAQEALLNLEANGSS